MTSALIANSQGSHAPALGDDLNAVGIKVLGESDCPQMLQNVIKFAPDLVIFYEANPGTALFECAAAVIATAPLPIVVFTPDPDAEKIAQATRAGVHAYVVNGYSQNRLRSVIHLAQARFRHDQLLRKELSEVNQRFSERTLVDRAKGILMGARQLREDEAYRALRGAAMHTKRRMGQVAQQVIDSARYGEAINRAGQLRMLSQRLAKLYALACAGVRPAETSGLFNDSVGHVDANLEILRRTLSLATFGDLLEAVLAPWAKIRTALTAPPHVDRLLEIDRMAEEMLSQAEQLTVNLEIAGFAAALHVINVAGRQRMLSQRLAKQALILSLVHRKATKSSLAEMERTKLELTQGLDYLKILPLSNADITRELGEVLPLWASFQTAIDTVDLPDSQIQIAELSEALLRHFDRLTDHIERGVQSLIQ